MLHRLLPVPTAVPRAGKSRTSSFNAAGNTNLLFFERNWGPFKNSQRRLGGDAFLEMLLCPRYGVSADVPLLYPPFPAYVRGTMYGTFPTR